MKYLSNVKDIKLNSYIVYRSKLVVISQSKRFLSFIHMPK